MQLAPRATAGMTVGTDIAQPEPAAIETVGIGTEMARGVHLAAASPRGYDAGWRAPGRLGDVLVGLLTGATRGLAGEARKRLRVAGALARWQRRWGAGRARHDTLGWPHTVKHQAQPQQSHQQQLVKK